MDRLCELFVYGKVAQHLEERQKYPPVLNAIRIYQESCSSTRRSVLCWIWVAKREKLLVPDLIKLIAKILWKTRKDPQEWGVKLYK